MAEGMDKARDEFFSTRSFEAAGKTRLS